MRWFHWLELTGKAILLLSVMFQLVVLSEFQGDATDVQIHGIQLKLDWIRHWLESGKPHPTIGWLPGNEFYIRSERIIAERLSQVFVASFCIGTLLTILARYFEIKKG
ncbi:MAG: hypothetical protein AAGD43_08000 [Pseudomonadota bacterium]